MVHIINRPNHACIWRWFRHLTRCTDKVSALNPQFSSSSSQLSRLIARLADWYGWSRGPPSIPARLAARYQVYYLLHLHLVCGEAVPHTPSRELAYQQITFDRSGLPVFVEVKIIIITYPMSYFGCVGLNERDLRIIQFPSKGRLPH